MIKRVFDLDSSEARKVRARQKKGTMSEIYDDNRYLCYDVGEYENWTPKKPGRKPGKE